MFKRVTGHVECGRLIVILPIGTRDIPNFLQHIVRFTCKDLNYVFD